LLADPKVAKARLELAKSFVEQAITCVKEVTSLLEGLNVDSARPINSVETALCHMEHEGLAVLARLKQSKL
jgi:hypothetical protein